MTLTKEKSNTHKQPKLHMMSVQSKDQTGMKRIFDRYQQMPKNDIRSSYVGLCGPRDRALGPVTRLPHWPTYEERMPLHFLASDDIRFMPG